ncbi:cytochrome c [Microbulbifer sp. SAOS-129_SWC]|uniref:c-type cytochrome n=1 Tax=Microbulbifer sp. SAOS-129_SWC TaxID=3145235 RepID=UPI0032178900
MQYNWLICAALLCLQLLTAAPAAAEEQESLAAQASNLLSYIAADYADAVRDGAVIDQPLYRQQQRNLNRALEMMHGLPDRPGRAALEKSVRDLDGAIAAKRSGEQVRRRANAAADRLAQLYQLQRSPAEMLPAASVAAPLYQKRCAACHGARGEGASGPALTDYRRMASFSLYDLYNILDPGADTVHARRLDADLSSRQRWALAVTVASLAVTGTEPPPVDEARRYPALVGLPGMATARPVELSPDAAAALMWWRGHPQRVRALQHPLARADGLLQLAESAYRAGDNASAYHQMVLALREGYLPQRDALAQRDQPLETQLSARWQALRSAILGDASNAEVIAAFQQLRSGLAQARTRLQPPPASDFRGWVTLLFAVSVVLGLLLWLRRRRR